MIVGEANVGKTTLRKYLAAGEKPLTTNEGEVNITTDGIDIEELAGKLNVTFDCWDFAGQELYYTTHQFVRIHYKAD